MKQIESQMLQLLLERSSCTAVRSSAVEQLEQAQQHHVSSKVVTRLVTDGILFVGHVLVFNARSVVAYARHL
jgi:hypothetical protein